MTPLIDDATPESTVRRWWLAWERKDHAELERLAREDYLEFTGHSTEHRVGRGKLLEVAARVFEQFTICEWSLSDLQQLFPTDDTALIGYRWELRAKRGDGTIRLHGVASDVLVREEGGWRYLCHHSSVQGEEAG